MQKTKEMRVQSLDRERKTKVKLEESPLMKKLDRE